MESAIRQPDRAKQVIDYGGVRFGNIMPTDLDGLVEYHDKGYILIEIKHRDTKIPKGQEVAYKRMVDDFKRIGKFACWIHSSHCVDDCNEIIKAEETIVKRVYISEKEDFIFVKPVTLGSLMNRIRYYLDTGKRLNPQPERQR